MVNKENVIFGMGILLVVTAFIFFLTTAKMENLVLIALLGIILIVTSTAMR